ncbi:hypothetical protein ACFQ07_33050 [Actinomadura adrarensis]|uniref:DUF7691 domain-containing protein n=1 Tax=Actinomadura adrarensis TaxID=1819600 RepID=A0ABW3CSZ8_9ACTN
MSYGIMPYAVNINVLRSPHTYTSDPDDFLAWIQERHCKDNDYGPTRESMREMFFGEPLTGAEGHVYGYTLKALCETFGAMLPNANWYPVRMRWFDAVQDALTQIGVRFDPTDLIYSGSPIPLPPIEDFPSIGHLRRDEAIPLGEALDAADISLISDENLTESIRELHGWLKQCSNAETEMDSYDLVCFYH